MACSLLQENFAMGRQLSASAVDAGAATQVNKLLCDEECLAKLDSIETQETKSGLKYKDIVVGKGPSPPTGYQACFVRVHHITCSLRRVAGGSRSLLLLTPSDYRQWE